jgi:hypothetical protein
LAGGGAQDQKNNTRIPKETGYAAPGWRAAARKIKNNTRIPKETGNI